MRRHTKTAIPLRIVNEVDCCQTRLATYRTEGLFYSLTGGLTTSDTAVASDLSAVAISLFRMGRLAGGVQAFSGAVDPIQRFAHAMNRTAAAALAPTSGPLQRIRRNCSTRRQSMVGPCAPLLHTNRPTMPRKCPPQQSAKQYSPRSRLI